MKKLNTQVSNATFWLVKHLECFPKNLHGLGLDSPLKYKSDTMSIIQQTKKYSLPIMYNEKSYSINLAFLFIKKSRTWSHKRLFGKLAHGYQLMSGLWDSLYSRLARHARPRGAALHCCALHCRQGLPACARARGLCGLRPALVQAVALA